MKIFTNKATEFNDGKGGNLTYAHLAIYAIEKVPDGGISTSDMEARLSIRKKFKDVASEAVIELEDDELEKIKVGVSATKWNVISQDIVDFTAYINSL